MKIMIFGERSSPVLIENLANLRTMVFAINAILPVTLALTRHLVVCVIARVQRVPILITLGVLMSA